MRLGRRRMAVACAQHIWCAAHVFYVERVELDIRHAELLRRSCPVVRIRELGQDHGLSLNSAGSGGESVR
jgi:hypothetical protein